VSPMYVTQTAGNSPAKIADCGLRIADSKDQSEIRNPKSEMVWHRMGDVGYLDEAGRFWYCGRKSQRVETADGPLYTECVESIFNVHPSVSRSALVGIGPGGRQTPVIVIEQASGVQNRNWERDILRYSEGNPLTRSIRHVLVHPSLPVDVRHNAKINRETLAAWASKKLAADSSQPPAPSP
jgi:olefin beta-lactone synthetase